MEVILLAAGRSTRLDPLSDKNLLEFCGKPLIVHQIEALKKVGLKTIVVVGGKHNLESLTTLFSKEKAVRTTEQKKLEDGQAGGVIAGAALIKGKKAMVMSTNDVFEESLFREILRAASEKNIDGVIAGKKVATYFPGGYLKFDKKNVITNVVEKPGAGREPSDLVNLVCHVYNNFPAFVQFLQTAKSKKDDIYEVALDAYIKKGARLKAFRYTGFWQAIKYPWHVLLLMNHFLEIQKPLIHKSAQVAKTAVIRGDVVISENAKVMDHAVIQGPAYIGENSVVANNALVRGSMVGKNCVIGYTTEIARSFLNHGIWTHTNYIGDSVVDSNVSFGAGGVTGNLRLDEQNVKMNVRGERLDTGLPKLGAVIGSGTRLGINCSINPGVKVGRNCFVGPGLLLDKDLEDGKMVTVKQGVKITKNKFTVHIEDRRLT